MNLILHHFINDNILIFDLQLLHCAETKAKKFILLSNIVKGGAQILSNIFKGGAQILSNIVKYLEILSKEERCDETFEKKCQIVFRQEIVLMIEYKVFEFNPQSLDYDAQFQMSSIFLAGRRHRKT